jgi:serine/threonine-protein kinase
MSCWLIWNCQIYKPSQHTTVGAKAITQGYSPPEQYGGGITDARSDIYSLGATLYTLVTGSVPVESVKRHMGAVFLHPREIVPEISTQTERLILKAMELNPDERYQTADQFCLALSSQVLLHNQLNGW